MPDDLFADVSRYRREQILRRIDQFADGLEDIQLRAGGLLREARAIQADLAGKEGDENGDL